jgi:hypothetical protein
MQPDQYSSTSSSSDDEDYPYLHFVDIRNYRQIQRGDNRPQDESFRHFEEEDKHEELK